jgi:hypothetical protein
MIRRTVDQAEQLLRQVPQDEMSDLIRLLQYYNSNFAEGDRARAVVYGSTSPKDPSLEREVEQIRSTKGSQNTYLAGTTSVCKWCGK